MSLTYSPASGLIKRDGVVIGAIEKKHNLYLFKHYKFKDRFTCSAATIEALLPKIKKELQR